MASDLDPRLAGLLDKQEIEEVVLRYCRGIDRRDFDLVRSCYHPDARDRHGSFDGTVDEAKQSDEPLLRNFLNGGGYGEA